MFDSRRYTYKNIKNGVKKRVRTFFLRLNPFFRKNERIKELEKTLQSTKHNREYYKDTYYHTRNINDNLRIEIKTLKEELTGDKKPAKKPDVVKFVTEKQRIADGGEMMKYANARAKSSFI